MFLVDHIQGHSPCVGHVGASGGSWLARLVILSLVLLAPSLSSMGVLLIACSWVLVPSVWSKDAFVDDPFTEFTPTDYLGSFFEEGSMFKDIRVRFWRQGLDVFTLLGVVFVRVVMSIGGRLLLFIPELLFRIPVVTPVYLFRSRGPACPHVPRPPPAFR